MKEGGQQIQQKPMAKTIKWKTKGRAKERPKEVQPKGTKERRGLILLVVRSYFTHNPSNVANMRIVRSNNNRRCRTNISHQRNLSIYSRG
jgi:hypothetical protein